VTIAAVEMGVERPLMAQSGHSKNRWPVSRRVSFARILNLKVAPDYRSCKRVVTPSRAYFLRDLLNPPGMLGPHIVVIFEARTNANLIAQFVSPHVHINYFVVGQNFARTVMREDLDIVNVRTALPKPVFIISLLYHARCCR